MESTGPVAPFPPTPTPSPDPAPQPPRAASPAVRVEGLVKRFGNTLAVDGLTMWVPRGSLFGFVGPNGAGKTTTLSMVTGLLRPDAGRVEVLGRDVWADPPAAKALMGVLPDGLRTFDRLSGRELLRFCGLLRRLDEAVVVERTNSLLEALDLTGAADTLVCDYSAGMTKKIGLACALIADPELLVLDEPLESVDPVSGQTIRAILRRFVDGGGTVVMSSHVMELVESMCDSVGVIAHGRLHAIGTVADVCGGMSLQDRFVQLVGGRTNSGEGLTWLRRS